MKFHSKIAAAFSAVVITAAAFAAEAASPAGNWKWTTQGRNGPQEATAKLEVKDGKLTGTVSGFQGDTPISEATFKDGAIAFSVERTFNDTKFVTKYAGKLEGDTIKGTIQRPGFQGNPPPAPAEWVASRVK